MMGVALLTCENMNADAHPLTCENMNDALYN